ncbi:malonic semialdehyde reductase [Notoacmeibacter ruber]|uniref:Malonic semialdehyde reductase n=1 Tax=Notoacmeibacter ruber TaxID=2670375 RepID=A0A3L7JFQ3_9HYPH|nr:malonic semialdehyde reductase [Notoacmeibacter ruber]RLQ89310.1 malonic semialdehyde reductase [Notoacmeibacter ruber]
MKKLPDEALNLLFLDARTANGFTDEDVPEETIHRLYDLTKMGPTASNSAPARFLFIRRGSDAKSRLLPHVSEKNRDKTEKAPWTVIVGYDTDFHTKMSVLFPDRANSFDTLSENPEKFDKHVMLNSSLQGAYMMIAARGLGLDCGPIGGFRADGVDAEFFEGHPERGAWRSSWLCNLGYMTPPDFKRLPRLSFEQGAAIAD